MNVIQTLPNGEHEVRGTNGKVLGPFRSRETAEAAERMLNAFNAIDQQIKQTNGQLQGLVRKETEL